MAANPAHPHLHVSPPPGFRTVLAREPSDHITVFDDFVTGSATVYTSDDFAEWLGDHDTLAIHCVVDRQVNTGSATGGIAVQIEHSNNGRNWVAKHPINAEIPPLLNVPAAGIVSLAGYDIGDTPGFHYGRLSITLAAPCTAAHVTLIVSRRRFARQPVR